MFEMNEQEFENWRTQFASSKSDRQGLRYAPYCFTEQGVTMVSCILNTKRAIAVNIRVIRVFSKMRGALMMSKDIFLKLEQLENRMKQQEERTGRQEKDMLAVVEALKQLIGPREHRPVVGFRRPDERRE
jgi:phage regulator Rha-like protein